MRHPALLAICCFLFCGTTLVWLRMDHAPPQWDDSWYLTNSLVMYDALTDGGLLGFAKRFLSILGFKAPLITVLPAPIFLVLGRRWHAAYLVNVAAIPIQCGAVWAIGKHLWSARTGLIAVYVAGTMPLLYGLSRWYLVEYPLTATVAVAIWLLLASHDLEDRRPVVLFGITCGFGLLLKVSFPLFVALPFAHALWRSRRRAKALLTAAVPCLLLALPWYLVNGRRTLRNAIEAGYGDSAIVQGADALLYLRRIVHEGISVYYVAAALLAAIVIAVRKPRSLAPLTPVLLWAAPFVVFLLGGNKDIRYVAPLLPAFALALGFLLDTVLGRLNWLLPVILAFPLASMLMVSFGRSAAVGYARPYDPVDWPQQAILQTICDSPVFKPGEKKLLLIGTDRGSFNVNNFELAVVRERLPLTVDTTAYEKDLGALLRTVDVSSFFVYKEGGEPESTFFNQHFAEIVDHVRQSGLFQELSPSRKLPDGGTAHIFRRVTR
jgi:hypothetical protein